MDEFPIPLNLFGPCFIPAVQVARPAQAVLHHTKVDPEAVAGPDSPLELTPRPVLIRHDDNREELLNPSTAGRFNGPLLPETLVQCASIKPGELNPRKLIELVEYRYRWLDPVWHGQIPEDPHVAKIPGKQAKGHDRTAMAALRQLHHSHHLQNLVLSHFFSNENSFSGPKLEALLGGQYKARVIQDWLAQEGMNLPWQKPRRTTTESRSSLDLPRQYWEAYRQTRETNLPVFNKAFEELQKHYASTGDNGVNQQVCSRILLDRLGNLHGENEAFEAIENFLGEFGHLLRSGSHGGGSDNNLPANASDPGAPSNESWQNPDPQPVGLEDNSIPASDDLPIPPFPDEPTDSVTASPTPNQASEPREGPGQSDPLMPAILEVTAQSAGPLDRSPECWDRILSLAREVTHSDDWTFYERLQERFAKRSNPEQRRQTLEIFLDQLKEQSGELPC